jgi:hypothetical protein
MATWGDFIKDVEVIRIGKKMYASIEQAIDLWEERRKLRERVAELEAGGTTSTPVAESEAEAVSTATPVAAAESDAASTREMCAQEVEEFARVCEEDGAAPEIAIRFLHAAAGMIRAAGEIMEAEAVDPEAMDDALPAEAVGIAEAEPVDSPSDDAAPEAEPVAEYYHGHDEAEAAILEAEPIPEAEPVNDGEHR